MLFRSGPVRDGAEVHRRRPARNVIFIFRAVTGLAVDGLRPSLLSQVLQLLGVHQARIDHRQVTSPINHHRHDHQDEKRFRYSVIPRLLHARVGAEHPAAAKVETFLVRDVSTLPITPSRAASILP